jgi:hypothetical protein
MSSHPGRTIINPTAKMVAKSGLGITIQFAAIASRRPSKRIMALNFQTGSAAQFLTAYSISFLQV